MYIFILLFLLLKITVITVIRIHLIFCFNNRPPKNSKPDPILTDEEEEEDSELIEAKIVLRDVSTTGKSILS